MSWDTIVAALQTAGTAAEGVGSGLLSAALNSKGTSSTAAMQGPKAPMEMPQMSSSAEQAPQMSFDPQSFQQPEQLRQMVEESPQQQTNLAPPTPTVSTMPDVGFGTKIGNTLLGSSPRTDSLTDFTGDTLQGLTNPHGLVGQGMRLLGTVAAFSQGIGPGVGFLSAMGKADALERANIAQAAALHMTPEEYRGRFGAPLPSDVSTSLEARDMPISRDPDSPQASPSMGERISAIQFPNTPAELEAASEAEYKYRRSLPNFETGKALEDMSSSGARAQRLGLPTDAPENTAATLEAKQNIPETGEQFKTTYEAGKGGLSAIMSQLPPENMSMSQEQWDSIKVPNGMFKLKFPDQAHPGQFYAKIVDEKGDSLIDVASKAADDDAHAQRTMDILNAYREGSGKVHLGSPEQILATVQEKIGRKLTADELTDFHILIATPMMPQLRDKALTAWYDRVGYREDPVQTEADIARTARLEELKKKPEAAPEDSSEPPAFLGPAGKKLYERAAPVIKGFESALSTIPTDSPAYVAPAPKALPKKFQRNMKTFQNLEPDDFGLAAKDIFGTYTRTKGDISETGKDLADTINLMKLTNEEKAIVISEITQRMDIPKVTKNMIEAEAVKRLRD